MITVSELISVLEKCSPDEQVMLCASFDNGDKHVRAGINSIKLMLDAESNTNFVGLVTTELSVQLLN